MAKQANGANETKQANGVNGAKQDNAANGAKQDKGGNGIKQTMERDKQMELIERIMGPSKTNGQASLT